MVCDVFWYMCCLVLIVFGIVVYCGWFDEEFGLDGIVLYLL